jgi:hypothetical protein
MKYVEPIVLTIVYSAALIVLYMDITHWRPG